MPIDWDKLAEGDQEFVSLLDTVRKMQAAAKAEKVAVAKDGPKFAQSAPSALDPLQDHRRTDATKETLKSDREHTVIGDSEGELSSPSYDEAAGQIPTVSPDLRKELHLLHGEIKKSRLILWIVAAILTTLALILLVVQCLTLLRDRTPIPSLSPKIQTERIFVPASPTASPQLGYFLTPDTVSNLGENGEDDDGDGDVDELDDDSDTGFDFNDMRFRELLEADGGIVLDHYDEHTRDTPAANDRPTGFSICARPSGSHSFAFQVWRYCCPTHGARCLGFYTGEATFFCPPSLHGHYLIIGYHKSAENWVRAKISAKHASGVEFSHNDNDESKLIVYWDRVSIHQPDSLLPEAHD